MSLRASSLWRTLRPKQWTKNIVVLAALIFAAGDPSQKLTPHAERIALAAMLIFCMASSGVYILNDLRDRPMDRAHPTKRLRPIAAGELTPGLAWGLAVSLIVASLACSWLVNPPFCAVIAAYLVIQALYTLGLKRIALVDVFVIALGFVLRALAGALAVSVAISPWLLLCTMLLALFLALCKRRHELVVVQDREGATRASLTGYDERLLDQLIAVMAGSTLVCYALYTLWPDTVAKFGTQNLGFTIPFVIFGLFRYLDLVYRQEKGGRPEQILLSDKPLLAAVALYGLTVLIILGKIHI